LTRITTVNFVSLVHWKNPIPLFRIIVPSNSKISTQMKITAGFIPKLRTVLEYLIDQLTVIFIIVITSELSQF